MLIYIRLSYKSIHEKELILYGLNSALRSSGFIMCSLKQTFIFMFTSEEIFMY